MGKKHKYMRSVLYNSLAFVGVSRHRHGKTYNVKDVSIHLEELYFPGMK